MADLAIKERAHELIDSATPEHVAEAVALLERYADPVAYSLANAPWEDEEISDEENAAAARADSGSTFTMDDILADLGFTREDLERHEQSPTTSVTSDSGR